MARILLKDFLAAKRAADKYKVEEEVGVHPLYCSCQMDFGAGKHDGRRLTKVQRTIYCFTVVPK